ncbi:MAG TPA: phosphatidate cytidylyltransferase, partial [Clostridia bacterium]|nr:phosphatidate cytidylyltransferase [Clostridia bacterium]
MLTAIMGAPLLLYLVYTGGAVLFLAVAALSCAGLWELKTLLRKKGFEINAPFSFSLGLVFLLWAYGGFSAAGGPIVFTVLLLAAFVQQVASRGPGGVVNALIMPGAVYYTFGLPSFIISLRGLDSGRELALLLLLAIWCADTAAYFGGMVFGKKKLAPGLSPNKTVEGAAAAIVAGVTLGALLAGILDLKIGIPWVWVPFGRRGISMTTGALI